MLAALESGVRGGTWFSLIDKVYSAANLRAAFKRVKRNRGSAGVDYQTIEMFEHNLEENLEQLRTQLVQGSYEPRPVKRVEIPKPGSKEKRPLGIPCVRDRVVQTALRSVLEPIFGRGSETGVSGSHQSARLPSLIVVDKRLRGLRSTLIRDQFSLEKSEKPSCSSQCGSVSPRSSSAGLFPTRSWRRLRG